MRSAVTLAFPRSPTVTAYAAWDLAKFSGGRFQFGLGTQIRQNVEDRSQSPGANRSPACATTSARWRALFRTFGTGEARSTTTAPTTG